MCSDGSKLHLEKKSSNVGAVEDLYFPDPTSSLWGMENVLIII